MAAIKRDIADAAFSDCVRERADRTCESCGKPASVIKLECAHIFGRKNKTLRQHPDNALCLCFSCHLYFTGNPLEFSDFVRNLLGDDRIEILREVGRGITKYNKQFVKDCAKHYREQYKILCEKRSMGEVGRIEFEAFI